MPENVTEAAPLIPGQIYEDGFFHPCLCVHVDHDTQMACGISLIDGSYPRSCDLHLGGVRRLTVEEAWRWKTLGPAQIEREWNAEVNASPDVGRIGS